MVNDPQIQVVIELVGGTTIAKTMILAALKLGKPVITANKALLSAHGEELFAAARQYGTNLYYEASVAGGIPIIKALREGFVGNRITHLYGIVNGTCNYILTRMKREGLDFAPDVAGGAAAGLCGGRSLPGHRRVRFRAQNRHPGIAGARVLGPPKDIHVEGIRSIGRADIEFAGKLGYTIKLLGVVKVVPGANRKSGNPSRSRSIPR